MPGWNSFVADSLIEKDAFPSDWIFDRDAPINLFSDPMINHVWRSWGQRNGGSGSAYQTVWRSSTINEAEQWFDKLKQQQFYFNKEAQRDLLIEFKTPKEIAFESTTANEYYLACGWYRSAYCELVARYENYNMDFRIDLEMDYRGNQSDGISYKQIQELFNSGDSKFSEFLAKNKKSSP